MKGFKTIAFGLALGLVSLLSNPEMQAFIAQHIPSIGGSIGGMIIFLRFITTSPIFKD